MPARTSRRNFALPREESLKERIWAPWGALRAMSLAHLIMSESEISRLPRRCASPLSVEMMSLRISCQTRPRVRVRWPSVMSAPWMPGSENCTDLPSSTA